jgi:hypothetical protein
MPRMFSVLALFSASMLTGCGLFVPQIRDFPNNTDIGDDVLVQAIVDSIHCELEDAVTSVINDNRQTAKQNGFNYGKFFEGWGAEVALTLTLDEKSSISPSGIFTPLSPLTSVFTLSGGLSASTDGQRVDKVNYYYKVRDLYRGPHGGKCQRDTNPKTPRESLLIQSDLKLSEWLHAMTNGLASGQITTVGKANVLSHEVTFDIMTTGNITPAWKLLRGTVNQSGTFLTASRDRKHDLTVTFGPLDNTQTALIPTAEAAHTTSLIVTGIKGALQQQ